MTNEQIVLRIKAGEDVAENMLQLYEQNKGFIYKMAVKYSQFAELEDLMQEAYIGLCEAVRHYNADQGATFLHYAAFWIKQGMMRYIECCGSVVRIPNHARQLIIRYKKIFGEYKKWYGREPSDIEMRAFLHVRQEKLEDIKKSLRMDDIQSLSKPVGGEAEEITLMDTIRSEESMEDLERAIDHEAMKLELWDVVDRLPEREAAAVRLRYQECMTLKETGQQLGVSTERARVIQASAVRKLRRSGKCNKANSYFEEYLSPSSIHHVGVGKFQRTWMSSVEEQVLGW